jgi:hypothetical protein
MLKTEMYGVREGKQVRWDRNADTKSNYFLEDGVVVHQAHGSYCRGMAHWVGFAKLNAVFHSNAGLVEEGGETALLIFPDGSLHFLPPHNEGGFIGMAIPSLAK